MGFWKWYLKGVLKTPQALISPLAEYIWAVMTIVFLSIFLSTTFSPFWLLFTVPVSVTIAAHSSWRSGAKGKAK